MINNTNTNSTNVVIPVSTKDNSGYMITAELHSTGKYVKLKGYILIKN